MIAITTGNPLAIPALPGLLRAHFGPSVLVAEEHGGDTPLVTFHLDVSFCEEESVSNFVCGVLAAYNQVWQKVKA